MCDLRHAIFSITLFIRIFFFIQIAFLRLFVKNRILVFFEKFTNKTVKTVIVEEKGNERQHMK